LVAATSKTIQDGTSQERRKRTLGSRRARQAKGAAMAASTTAGQ
jgi:hypothetical protein